MSAIAPQLIATDVDSHEMIPIHMWEDTFGPEVRPLAHLSEECHRRLGGEDTIVRPDVNADEMEITESTIWNVKGPMAPGAIDMTRRTELLRAMGVERQLVFSTFALTALVATHHPDAPIFFRYDPALVDAPSIGRAAIHAYNRWVANVTRKNAPAGVVPVALVLTDTLDGMMRQTEEALAGGVRAIWLPSGYPPGNMSPAHRALDPFWAMLAAANVPALLHLSTEFALISERWHRDVPEFIPVSHQSLETSLDPFSSATLNLANETFLTAMILGGVFERHPNLRFGIIECGAHWVGPFAERLDAWWVQYKRLSNTLTMKPSEYLARNVRVTPFIFEPVASYFERWPNLSSVYSYSSDYPHLEGGKEAKRRFYEEIARLGDDIVNRFFYENGRFLLPA